MAAAISPRCTSKNPRFWCKCGVEQRDFVPRNYGGYFYCKGLEVGLARYQTVRNLVDEFISPDVDVILKRFCTEFELMLGPSDKYQPPDWADEREKQIWETTEFNDPAFIQPKYVRDHAIQYWMLFAWGRGDKTVMLYNNGQPLFPPSVTYHKGKG